MDVIELKGIACKVRLGDLFIDLRLETDLADCGRRDDFRAAVDYWDVEKIVREAAQAKPWRLLQNVAARAAEVALARYKQVDVARVRAAMRPAPPRKGPFAAVELSRARGAQAATPDRVWVHAIDCGVKIGVPERERRRPQKIVFDVGLEVQDGVRPALDAESLAGLVREAAESRPWRLLEAVAERVAEILLRRRKRALAVIVRAQKRPTVMPKTDSVVVEIERRRSHVSL